VARTISLGEQARHLLDPRSQSDRPVTLPTGKPQATPAAPEAAVGWTDRRCRFRKRASTSDDVAFGSSISCTRAAKWHAGNEVDDARSPHALADNVMAVVRRRGHVPDDVRDGADAVKVDGMRIVHVGAELKQDSDRTLLAYGLLGGRDRLLPHDRDRSDDAGKENGIPDRHDDQRVGRSLDGSRVRVRGRASLQGSLRVSDGFGKA
jgi:hypothetical protein